MCYGSFHQQSSLSKPTLRLSSRNGSGTEAVHKSIMDRESDLITCPRLGTMLFCVILLCPSSTFQCAGKKDQNKETAGFTGFSYKGRIESIPLLAEAKKSLSHFFHYFESSLMLINIFPPVSFSETFAARQLLSKAFVLLLSWKGRRGVRSELKQWSSSSKWIRANSSTRSLEGRDWQVYFDLCVQNMSNGNIMQVCVSDFINIRILHKSKSLKGQTLCLFLHHALRDTTSCRTAFLFAGERNQPVLEWIPSRPCYCSSFPSPNF